jgi:hypothetical protein
MGCHFEVCARDNKSAPNEALTKEAETWPLRTTSPPLVMRDNEEDLRDPLALHCRSLRGNHGDFHQIGTSIATRRR